MLTLLTVEDNLKLRAALITGLEATGSEKLAVESSMLYLAYAN
jgi:hypothetical protein